MENQNSENIKDLSHKLKTIKNEIAGKIEILMTLFYKGGTLFNILSYEYNIHDLYGKYDCDDNDVSELYKTMSLINELITSLNKSHDNPE